MTHGSLFSGIGGFDLAAEWMGWENKFHCEWNEFGQKVLHHYWPNAEQFTDITKTDFTKYANSIDIISGGFPCQPYSLAGKRKGKEDERHLWPEMLRAIREIRPRWVVGENVFGLINWSGGLVFHEVQTDLEAEGYEVFPYVLAAASVNAPHRRDRVWFVAFSKSARTNRGENSENAGERIAPNSDNDGSHCSENGQSVGKRDDRNEGRPNKAGEFEGCAVSCAWTTPNTDSNGQHSGNGEYEINTSEGGEYAQRNAIKSDGNGYATDTDSWGLEGATKVGRDSKHVEWENGNTSQIWDAADTEAKRLERLRREKGRYSEFYRRQIEFKNWQNFPTQSPICNGYDGLSSRLDSITFPKWRNESIKAGGNAIVPQVALQIFKAIEQYENLTKR